MSLIEVVSNGLRTSKDHSSGQLLHQEGQGHGQGQGDEHQSVLTAKCH